MTDRWEEAFDSWTPGSDVSEETDPDFEPDRDELLRLARALAEQRRTEQEVARTELEALKESLRERASAVAEREQELLDLQKRLEKGKGAKSAPPPAVDTEAVAARERSALERLQAVETRERELEARSAALEAESKELAARGEALQLELEAAREAQTDRELVSAERQRLEERLEEARTAEKELAALRLELERQRGEIEVRERAVAARTALPDDTQPDPYEDREQDLRRLEARLESRERELALVRQGLDAQRIELGERERSLRRREVADVRQSYEAPLTPPSFGDGLAAFVSSRSRR